MASFRKGEISIDPKTKYRRIYDGTKWRRLCSVRACQKRVQIKGLCARHLRESYQSISDQEPMRQDHTSLVDQFHFTDPKSASDRRNSIESSLFDEFDDIDLIASPTSSSLSTSFSPPQEQLISHCQYRISLDDTSGCSENIYHRCTHCSLGFCYSHAVEHRQYVQSMYNYLEEKISHKYRITSMTINRCENQQESVTNRCPNFQNSIDFTSGSSSSKSSNDDDPLADLMDWLEEQESLNDHQLTFQQQSSVLFDDPFNNDNVSIRNAKSSRKKCDEVNENFKTNNCYFNTNLNKRPLTDDDVRIMANHAMDNNKFIESLNCSDKQISEKGAEYLSDALCVNRTIKSLNLRNNQIKDLGLQHLSLALRVNNTLTHLDISNNQIQFSSLRFLGQTLTINQTLTSLDLGHNFIESNGMRSLSAGLAKNGTLKSLDLRYNQIDSRGIRYLTEALEVNQTLSSLNLTFNFIGNTGAHLLSEALQKRQNYLFINLHGTGIDQRGLDYLYKSLRNTQIEICADMNNQNVT